MKHFSFVSYETKARKGVHQKEICRDLGEIDSPRQLPLIKKM
jgi:hypothetical protein